MMRSPLLTMLSLLAVALLVASSAWAEDAERPVLLVANPLGVPLGTTTKIKLRGQKLDNAKEVLCADGKSTAKIVGQGGVGVPNMLKAENVGDKFVEIELTVPEDAAVGELALTVVTEKGTSEPLTIYLGGEYPLLAEKEGNDGFRTAQAIAVPQIVDGSIHGDRNVDCFAIEAAAGQKLSCEVFAARRGSGLDPLLSLYDDRGQLLASHDDLPDSRDARIEITLPTAGKFYLVIQDAHDIGSEAHPYRLVVK